MSNRKIISVWTALIFVLQLIFVQAFSFQSVEASNGVSNNHEIVFSIVSVDPTSEEMLVKISFPKDSDMRQYRLEGIGGWNKSDVLELTVNLKKNKTLYARSKPANGPWNNEGEFKNTGTPPDFTITRSISKNSIIKGQSVDITYTLNPVGSYNVIKRQPVDIVYVIDTSYSMHDSIGNNKNKMRAAKDVVKASIENIKAIGASDKVAVVAFNRYSRIVSMPTTDYESVKSLVEAISYDDGYSFDSGTNYEVGLRTAKSLLQTGSNSKHMIFVTDGQPNFYINNFNKYDSAYDYHLEEYARKNGLYSYVSWYYGNGVDTAYRSFFNAKKLGSELGLNTGEFVYENESIYGKAYTDAKAMATDIATSGITINTIGVGQGNKLDMGYLRTIAALGGGQGYHADNIEDLNAAFDYISDSIKQQQISSIIITEQLPAGVTVAQDSRNGVVVEGNKIKIAVPSIVFEQNKPTAPVSAKIALTFNEVGTYQLSGEVSYNDYKGDPGRKLIDPATINVGNTLAGNIVINNGDKFTNNKSGMVSLSLSMSGNITKMKLANTVEGLSSAPWQSFSASKEWTLLSGEGIKSVFVKFGDAYGNETPVYSDSIVVDTIAPTATIQYSAKSEKDGSITATLLPSEVVSVLNNMGLAERKFLQNGEFVFEFVDEAGNRGSAKAVVTELSLLIDFDFNSSHLKDGVYRTQIIQKGSAFAKLKFNLNTEISQLEVYFTLESKHPTIKSDLLKLEPFNISTITLLDSENKPANQYNVDLTMDYSSKDMLGIKLVYNNPDSPMPAGNYEMVVKLTDKGGLKADDQLGMQIKRVNDETYRPANSYSGLLYIDVVKAPKIL